MRGREGRKGREGEIDTVMYKRDTSSGCFPHTPGPDKGSNLHPRHMPFTENGI